ncbi:TetR/AcrR family transcriptional regulator [Dietzia sp. PP-33]|jgi:AcrR family transcriptional regulator|uniref:TetR/AcrR family transcriptional regulator n=1 Tax=Dietzia sp. PP-33 TaxID=2957500 RepID=UPI0029B6614B|nr:TetR/AcrR family transcriptional regulator [Dietzia sp. PP-33]MDX2357478.1 TetR/AcrR family transcriptional regulator [Dietzia sp. PP-33]
MPSSARHKPVQKRSQATIEKILDTTARLLISNGYIGLTTNQIASEAEIGIGTVYRYFADKNELLIALRDRTSAEMTDELTGVVTSSLSFEPTVAVRQLFALLVEAVEHNAAIINALANEVPMGLQGNILPEVEGHLMRLGRHFLAYHRPDLSENEVSELSYIGVTVGFAAAMRIGVKRAPHMDRQRLIDCAGDALTAWIDPQRQRVPTPRMPR